MWSRSHSITTKEVTAEQLWSLWSDVNNWQTWDKGIEYAKMEGDFEKGNYFILRPKGGPTLKIQIVETIKNKKFTDCTSFPLAKMYGNHMFENTSDGLKITTTMTVQGALSFLWIKLVAGNIVKQLPADMQEQIKAASKL